MMLGAGPHVILLATDIPGFFTPLAYRLGACLREQGVQPVFVASSPYYERFKGVNFGDLGAVHYVSEFIAACPSLAVADVELDYWLTYPTYVRTRYYWGRHLNTWDDYRKVLLFFRDLFDKYQGVRALWSEIPSNSILCIAHAEASKRSIPYLGYASARIPGHFSVSTDLYSAELLPNLAPTYANPDGAPDYMKSAAVSLTAVARRFLRDGPTKLWRGLANCRTSSLEIGHGFELQYRALMREVGRRIYYRTRIPRSLFSSLPDRDPSSLALVFPLHYRPEASTSVQARFYEDDVEIIRNIAFSQPHRCRLYVKEHPSAVGIRSRAFYDQIRDFPGVHIIAPETPLRFSLPHFDAIICLTSTAGFEALQIGLPVFLLGESFYGNYPGVTKVSSWAHLAQVLASLRPGASHRASADAMTHYLRHCFPGNFAYTLPEVLALENVDRLAAPIVRVAKGSFGR